MANAPSEIEWTGPLKSDVDNTFRYTGTKTGASDAIYWAQSGKISEGQNYVAIWNLDDNRAVKETNKKDASNM